jgi:hypothetical protein
MQTEHTARLSKLTLIMSTKCSINPLTLSGSQTSQNSANAVNIQLATG